MSLHTLRFVGAAFSDRAFLVLLVLVVSTGLALRWFVSLDAKRRRDVIRLISALRRR